MTLNFDPSADFARAIDGAESVTLRRRGADPGSSGTIVAHALRRALHTHQSQARSRQNTWKTVPSGGHYTAGDLVWHLPAEELSEPPRPGDVIVDASNRRFTILEIREATLRSRWQCFARNLAVAYGLDDAVCILKAVYAKGDGGAAETTWRTWKTGVRARIQPVAADATAASGARQTIARYQIFLEEDAALDPTHLIRGPDGTFYKIQSAAGAGRIDELQTVDAIQWSPAP